jgi:hypothetical protein
MWRDIQCHNQHSRTRNQSGSKHNRSSRIHSSKHTLDLQVGHTSRDHSQRYFEIAQPQGRRVDPPLSHEGKAAKPWCQALS